MHDIMGNNSPDLQHLFDSVSVGFWIFLPVLQFSILNALAFQPAIIGLFSRVERLNTPNPFSILFAIGLMSFVGCLGYCPRTSQAC
jgi:hypothetical protein